MKKKIIGMMLIIGIGIGVWYGWQIGSEKGIITPKEVAHQVEGGQTAEAQKGTVAKIVEKIEEVVFREKNTLGKESVNSGEDVSKRKDDDPKSTPSQEEISSHSNSLESEIVAKYKGQFAALRNEYQGKVNALIGQAKGEYLSLSEEERGKAKWRLAFKYLGKGSALESECDARFEAILSRMKNELKQHNFSNHAVQEAKAQYKSEKNARRRYLMSKALGR
jgi:hypothetical protein